MTDQRLSLSRVLVVLILVDLFVVVVAAVWRAVVPAGGMEYLLIVCPLACLEGLYSARLVQVQNLQSPDMWKFRVVELIGIGLLVKLGAALSSANFAANLLTFDARTLGGLGVTVLLWYSTLDTASNFRHLDNPPAPAFDRQGEYTSPLAHLTARYFVGGILMFTAVGIMSATHFSLGALVPAMFAYFVIGLLLLPGLRLQMARREWRSLGIQATDRITTPWLQAGIALVVLAAIIAILLPTGYLNGLLEFLRNVIMVVGTLLTFLITLITWLISIPARLLMGTPVDPKAGPPVMPDLPQVIANPGDSALTQILQILPKIALLVVVGYIVVSYFRDHPELGAMIRRFRLVQIWASLWAALRRGVGNFTHGVRVRLPATLPIRFGRRVVSRRPFGYVRLNALSARERVLYFYLSTLRRAEEHGVPRAPAQTPHEYGETLKPMLPEGQAELDHLSDAFIEARYSNHPVEPVHAKQAQSNWQRVKQALRAVKRGQSGPS